jgi:hypothetical protein
MKKICYLAILVLLLSKFIFEENDNFFNLIFFYLFSDCCNFTKGYKLEESLNELVYDDDNIFYEYLNDDDKINEFKRTIMVFPRMGKRDYHERRQKLNLLVSKRLFRVLRVG